MLIALWFFFVAAGWYGIADEWKKKGAGWCARNLNAGATSLFGVSLIFIVLSFIFGGTDDTAEPEQKVYWLAGVLMRDDWLVFAGIILICLPLFVWYLAAFYFSAKGYGVIKRHALGIILGFFAFVAFILSVVAEDYAADVLSLLIVFSVLAALVNVSNKKMALKPVEESTESRADLASRVAEQIRLERKDIPPVKVKKKKSKPASLPTATQKPALTSAAGASLYSAKELRNIAFQYTDAEGNTSFRKVSVNNVIGSSIDAYCLKRRAKRTFRMDRIDGDITLTETGEQMSRYEWRRIFFNSLV